MNKLKLKNITFEKYVIFNLKNKKIIYVFIYFIVYLFNVFYLFVYYYLCHFWS